MWSSSQRDRLYLERQLLARELPQFSLHLNGETAYVIGWQGTSRRGKRYQLKLLLPEYYPDDEPELFVTSPRVLRKHGWWGSVNGEGVSHAFHTLDNGPGGCVQICHDKDGWDASKTCVSVLMKGICWLEAYEAHLATGGDIAEFMC